MSSDTSTPPPVEPFSEIDAWTAALRQISAQPLEFCPEFPRIAERLEAWWANDLLDRPVLIASANENPHRPITRRLDLLESPERWLEAKVADMRQTRRFGDTLPTVRVDFGAVLLGGMLGGELEFGADTGWTHAFIGDDWSNEPDWILREDNKWWRMLRELTDLVAAAARGRYVLCTPDLGGSGDVLLNLRGATGLCMDTMENAGRIGEALNRLYRPWRQAYGEIHRRCLTQGAGLVHFFGLWSNRPYMAPACDFSAMIGPRTYRQLFLPDIARQAASVGRAIYHLDGPDAVRHLDSLLETPEILGIQFTPGEGAKPALRYVGMFKGIQAKGRRLLIFCRAEEVLPLCEEIDPRGLAFYLDAPADIPTLEALEHGLCARFGSAHA